jgi:general secretion pathway protein N
MDWLRRSPLLGALAAAAVVLALIVALELWGGIRPAPSARPARPAAPADAKLLPPVTLTSAEQAYPEIAARPLWVPTRRPAPQAAAAAAQSFKRDQYVLQGVTIAGDTRIALLREKASGRVHRVEAGKDLNGLKLVEVRPEAVTLAQGDDRETLELLVQKAAPGPAGAAAMAASQGPFADSPGAVNAPAGAAPQPGTGGAPVPAQGATARNAPVPANAPGAAVPQQATTAPMTAEELLARRRARRNPSSK